MTFQPNCLPTAIGSLPFDDPIQAVELVEKNLVEIPHWPQLPKKTFAEHFIYQYLSPLVEIGMIKVRDGKSFIDSTQQNWDEMLTQFYTMYLEALEGNEEELAKFAFPAESAAGFYTFMNRLKSNGTEGIKYLKGQVSGPLSVALTLTDHNKRSAYYDPQLRDILVKTLAMHAKWQARMLALFGLPVMIFIDDPSIYALGASTYITLTREDVITDINAVADAISSENGLVGVHSCANADWSLLFESNIDIVSFDAFEYFDSVVLYGSQLASYIKKGGVLAWGIVPTSEKIMDESVSNLKDLFMRQVEMLMSKGIDKEQMLKQVLITPSCGTGTLDEKLAEKIYTVLKALAEDIRQSMAFM